MSYYSGYDAPYYYLRGVGAGGVLLAIVLVLAVYAAVNFILRWNMFIKAGERGWKSLIPFYGSYTEWKIAGFGKEYISLLLVGIGLVVISLLLGLLGAFGAILDVLCWVVFGVLLFIITIRKSMCLAHCFGQSDLFGLLALVVFSSIGLLVLSWGVCSYKAPEQKTDAEGNPIPKKNMLTGIFSDIKAGKQIDG